MREEWRCSGECIETLVRCCSAITLIDNRPFFCTRNKGHVGPHQACGDGTVYEDHPIHEWLNGEEVTPCP